MIIAVDFDGTIVENAYPEIGEPMKGAREALQYFREEGHTIIINSCRAGIYADNMRKWLKSRMFHFDFINENDPKRTAQYGGDTRKISADIYIDDKNVFCRSINWFDIMAEVERLACEKQKKTRVDIVKLIEMLYHHPDMGSVFDTSTNPPTFTLSREELEELITKAEVKKK